MWKMGSFLIVSLINARFYPELDSRLQEGCSGFANILGSGRTSGYRNTQLVIIHRDEEKR